MTSSDSENTNNKVARFKPSRRFYVFLISLFLASAFWLLNALNKKYVEGVDIAIKYINLPNNRAFSPVPPKLLKIQLSGDGYSLMQFMDEASEDTVIVDIDQLDFESSGARKKAVVSTSTIVNELRSSLGNGVTVSRVSLDSLVINTERGISSKLTVKPNYFLSVKKGFVLMNPVYAEPEIVTLNGPVSRLRKKIEVETQHVAFDEISETTTIEIPLALDKRYLTSGQKTVKLIAEVEPVTEGEIEVSIQIDGLPDDKHIRLIPNTIKIKYTTGLSHYKFIVPELFNAIVSYQDLQDNPSKLEVKIISYPAYLTLNQFLPERVDYLKLDLAD